MNDLNDFLLRRIAEDEAAAKDATWARWSAEGVWASGVQCWGVGVPDQDDDGGRPMILAATGPNGRADVLHASRHDPARVLAECDAKRRIVEAHRWEEFDDEDGSSTYSTDCDDCRQSPPCRTLRLLALPYAGYPDYSEAWSVGSRVR